MKLVALYKTFDGGEFVDASLASIYDHCDHIVMVHSDVSWLGEQGNTVRERAIKWCVENDHRQKVHHVDFDSTSQEKQYQAGLDYITSRYLKYDLIFVVDADEVWESKYIEHAKNKMASERFIAARCHMQTYLKTPFYRVVPQFGNPVAFLRDPRWLLKSPRGCRAPAITLDNVWMHHFTYVRESREVVARKIEQSGKADGGERLVPQWMETVYDHLPSGENLHAFDRWRSVWRKIEKVWLCSLPPAMRTCQMLPHWLPPGLLMDGEKAAIIRLAKGRKQAVDLGTFRGLSAVLLSLACDKVHTVDLYEDIMEQPPDEYHLLYRQHQQRLEDNQKLFERFGNITCEKSHTVFAAQHWSGGCIDALFVDADHSEAGTLENVLSWLPHMERGGVIILHDNNDEHPGVQRAVERMREMPHFSGIDPGEYAGSIAAFEVVR